MKREPLRIVAMADTHLYHDDLQVPDGDWLVHAGDLTRSGSLAQLEIATDWLRSFPHGVKIVIAGNHELCVEKRPGPSRRLLEDGLTYLQDETVVIDGLRVYGSPWQPWFHSWAFNVHRGDPIAAKWAKIPEDTDILITHGPPAGIGDRVGDERVGCEDLRARVAIVRPRLHIFGHIHTDRGQWEEDGIRYINATTDEGQAPPTVIELPR